MHKILDAHDKDMRAAIPLTAGFNDTAVTHLTYASGQTLADALHQYTLKGHLDVAAVHRDSVNKFETRLKGLLELFPTQTRTEADRILDRDELDEPLRAFIDQGTRKETQESRQKRFLWGLLSSTVGTFYGLYNRRQLSALQEDVTVTKRKQQELFKVSRVHAKIIQQLDTAITEIARSALLSAANPAAVTNAKLQQMIDLANRSLDKALRALQAAQHRRLSVDFLDPDQLRALFTKLSTYADSHDKKMLLEHPSDLLQVELSYFFTGKDITFLLHVPMVPAAALLRLVRYRPFPLPLDDSTGLMPILERDVLAISDASALDGKRLTMEVKFSDLMECHQINSVYLCERHGNLNYQSNTSCLAALYGQDHDAALNLCQMNVIDLDEAVLPLGKNGFLIYNDQPGYNAEMTCLRSPVQDIILKKGINTIKLPEHCTLRLRNSVVFADSSIHLDTDFLTYDWDWARSFSHTHLFKDSEFLQELHQKALSQVGTLNLVDVFQTAEQHEATHNTNRNLYLISGFLALVAGLLGAAYTVSHCRDRQTTTLLRYLAAAVYPRLQPLLNTLPNRVQRFMTRSSDLSLPFTNPTFPVQTNPTFSAQPEQAI